MALNTCWLAPKNSQHCERTKGFCHNIERWRRQGLIACTRLIANVRSEDEEMKIGILTGGGDCPGLNAVIRAIVRKGIFHYDDQFVGFMEGWRGVLENNTLALDIEAVKGILPQGGTILRTSRTNPAKKENGLELCIKNLKKNGVQAMIALGGDDTQSVSQKLFERGVNVIAVPKTID